MIYGSGTYFGSGGYYGGAGSGGSTPAVQRDVRTVIGNALLLVRDTSLVNRDPYAYTNEREWTVKVATTYPGTVDSAQIHFRDPSGNVNAVTAVDEGSGYFTYEIPDTTQFDEAGVWHMLLVLTIGTAVINGSEWIRVRIGQAATVT